MPELEPIIVLLRTVLTLLWAVLTSVLRVLNQGSGLLIAILTAALVYITYLYLRETRRQRKLTEKAVLVDTSPKVFIKEIAASSKFLYDDTQPKSLEPKSLDTFFIISLYNCGKTEGLNVTLDITVKSPDTTHRPFRYGPVSYIFPGQLCSLPRTRRQFALTPDQIAQIHRTNGRRSGYVRPQPDQLWRQSPSLWPPIKLDIILKYQSVDGQQLPETHYEFQYIMNSPEGTCTLFPTT